MKKIIILVIVLVAIGLLAFLIISGLKPKPGGALKEKDALKVPLVSLSPTPSTLPTSTPESTPTPEPTPTSTPEPTPTPTPTPSSLAPLSALIGNFVWDDKNADGIQAADEPGIPGALVVLYDGLGNVVNSTTTNGAGLYAFTVQPGTYSEVFVPPKGYIFSPQDQGSNDAIDSDADPYNGKTASFTVAAGQGDLTWDAGPRISTEQSAIIGDFVWCDKNYNCLQDTGEPGIPYIWVFLYGNGSNLVGSTITDPNGNYYFTVQPGTYSLCFAPPPFTCPHAGPDDIDSDADSSTGCTPWFTVAADQIDLTWDAGSWKF